MSNKINIRNIFEVFKMTFKQWWDRDPFRESSVIAYNMIFSLPGLLVIVITGAGYFFGTEAVSGTLHKQIAEVMGNETADEVQKMILLAYIRSDSWIATAIAILTIIAGATGVFVQMQKTLNIIWEVKATTHKSGIWTFLKVRIFSFGLIVSIAFILLASLVLTSVLTAVSDWVIAHWSESFYFLFQILNVAVTIALTTFLFAMMFKILPDAKIRWKLVWIGAFVTAFLFSLGKSALGLYFGKADPASGYGAAGSVVLILLWASYSSMIVFFGAQFTKVFSDFFNGDVPASENAVKQKSQVI